MSSRHPTTPENPDGGSDRPFIMEQGITTVNCDVPFKQIYESRSQAANNKPEDRIGSLQGGLGGNNSSSLAVFYHDPMFAHNTRYSENPNNPSVSAEFGINGSEWKVWSSFNGMDVSEFKGNQEKFEEAMEFVGYALGEVHPGDIAQDDTGIAIAIRGSWSSYWHGTDHGRPGDAFIIRPPTLDEQKRKEERKNMVFAANFPPEKILGFCEVWKPDHIKRKIGSAVNSLFDGNVAETLKISSLYTPSVFVNQNDRSAISIKQFILNSIVSGISVLSRYGLVTVNLPDIIQPLTQLTYEKNADILHPNGVPLDLISATEDHITADASGRLSRKDISSMSESERNTLEIRRRNELLYLSVLTGLVSSKNPSIVPHPMITEALLGSVLHRYIEDLETADAYNPVNLFNRAATFTPGTISQFREPNLSTLEGQFAKNSNDSFTNAVMSFSDIVMAGNRQKAGILLSSASPGNPYDYLRN